MDDIALPLDGFMALKELGYILFLTLKVNVAG